MNQSKPGFGVFLKKRLRHPFRSSVSLVYKSKEGVRFKDTGSAQTWIISVAAVVLFIDANISFSLTVLGELLLITLVLAICGVFRYFWTDFEQVDEEGRATGDVPVYSLKKKISIALEAVLVLAVIFGATVLAIEKPYGKIQTAHEFPFTHIDHRIDTAAEAYAAADEYMQEHMPEAELVGQVLDERWYEFTYRNPNYGILVHKTSEVIEVNICVEESDLFTRYSPMNLKWMLMPQIEPPVQKLEGS